MPLAIGIDLGTTNSVAAVATPQGVNFALGSHGERIHPSVVAFPAGAGVIAGHAARACRLADPTSTIYSAKRLIGQNLRSPLVQLALSSLPYRVEEGINQQPIIVAGDRRLTVPEISAQVLAYLKRLAETQFGDIVAEAVITVPANFSDAQRQATKEAGRLAGLEVLRLINEPTAAALAYGYGQRLDETVVVFDFGGGTFDVSILRVREQLFEVLATDGDYFLGGDDLDRCIAEFLAAEMSRQLAIDPRTSPQCMSRLALAAEEIKRYLSTEAEASGTLDGLPVEGRHVDLPFSLTRDYFNHLIEGYVERTMEVCRQVLTAARLEVTQISDVLCVGGSTRIPLVRDRLAQLFGRYPSIDINPDEVVAQGAAIQAASLSGRLDAGHRSSDAPARPLLLDVTPSSLGIATAGGYVEKLLDKNAPIPIERSRLFTTARADQDRVVIDCCRGESKRFDENEFLGQLVLEKLPLGPRGAAQIEVTFRVDTDGILHVRARDDKTGNKCEARLQVVGAPSAA